MSSFTVISTFAGCGGSSLGYKLAGGKVLAAVEWDDNAVATYQRNFPDTPMLHRDIGTVTAEELLTLTGLRVGELDVLDGSPPCQGFSTAGKREMGDPRNSLFREYVRLLRGLKPKCCVMENVSGMVKGQMKLVFAEVMRELKASGYRVRARLLNAMYYGVPQSRERMIFVGVREDLGIEPSHPIGRTHLVTVADAIGHLPVGEPGSHEPQVLAAWYKARPGQALRKACKYVGSFQSVRVDPNRPSPTQIKAHLNWHWIVPRQLTIQEAAILQSFPDSYQWVGSKAEAKERIGNSVPPRFMQAIAEHIRNNILSR